MKNIHDSMFAPGICSAGYMVTDMGLASPHFDHTFSIVFKDIYTAYEICMLGTWACN
jgi:hypothetical protein